MSRLPWFTPIHDIDDLVDQYELELNDDMEVSDGVVHSWVTSRSCIRGSVILSLDGLVYQRDRLDPKALIYLYPDTSS